jgi:hypothetical protein
MYPRMGSWLRSSSFTGSCVEVVGRDRQKEKSPARLAVLTLSADKHPILVDADLHVNLQQVLVDTLIPLEHE